MNEKWTSLIVADRIREAAETLKRLPDHHPGKRYRCALPTPVRNPNEAYGYTPLEAPLGPPAASAIDRMDEVILDWMKWLESDEIKIIWSWVLGVPARIVGGRLGVHRSTVHRRRIGVLKKLAVFLNAADHPIKTADLKDD